MWRLCSGRGHQDGDNCSECHQQEEHESFRAIRTQDLGPFQDRPKLLWVMQALIRQGLLCHPCEEGPICQAPRMPEHEDIYSPAFVTHRERLKKDPTGVPKARVGLLARSHWHPHMSLMEGPGMGIGRPSQRWTLGVSSGKDCPR